MPLTLDDMVRRVALKTGYSGTDHDATGGSATIIKEAITDAHAELAFRKKADFAIDAHPDAYARVFVRYYQNEAEQRLSSSRSLQEYEMEEQLAFKAICRVIAANVPAETDEERESRELAEAIRYI